VQELKAAREWRTETLQIGNGCAIDAQSIRNRCPSPGVARRHTLNFTSSIYRASDGAAHPDIDAPSSRSSIVTHTRFLIRLSAVVRFSHFGAWPSEPANLGRWGGEEGYNGRPDKSYKFKMPL
jgi:hypothetical protein